MKLSNLSDSLKNDRYSFMLIAEKLRKCLNSKQEDEQYLKFFDTLIDIKETKKSSKIEELMHMVKCELHTNKSFASTFNTEF